MIRTGVMRLSLPEADDAPERWLRGHYPDGGYWLDVRRLADHDHSGGEQGAPVAGTGDPALEARVAALKTHTHELGTWAGGTAPPVGIP